MSTLFSILFAAAAALVDFGWQPLDEGGHEYIVQVPPEQFDLVKSSSEGFESYVPPGVTDIRRIRIVIGNAKLPRDAEVLNAASKTDSVKNTEHATANTSARPSLGESVAPADQTSEPRTAAYRNATVALEPSSVGSISGSDLPAQYASTMFGIDVLTLSQIGLSAAIGLAAFVIFLHVGLRSRYRALLRQSN